MNSVPKELYDDLMKKYAESKCETRNLELFIVTLHNTEDPVEVADLIEDKYRQIKGGE